MLELARDPVRNIIGRWNWKSALFSSLFRSSLFFSINYRAGLDAAVAASAAEFCLAATLAGCYGSITQSFRKAEPAWLAALTTMFLMPAMHHTLEFLVHLARGTPRLGASILASMSFTALATLFNWFAMRRGVMVVGNEGGSLWQDMKAMPRIVVAFVVAGPLALFRAARADR